MSPAESAIREALAAGPTDGPWVVYPETDGTEICAVDMAPGLPVRQMVARPHLQGKWIANASLIAACNPVAIRSLLSEIDALRAERDKIEADLESLQDSFGQLQADNVKLRARCEAAERVVDQCARTMRGEGVNDQAEAWDKTLGLLDAHLKGAGRE